MYNFARSAVLLAVVCFVHSTLGNEAEKQELQPDTAVITVDDKGVNIRCLFSIPAQGKQDMTLACNFLIIGKFRNMASDAEAIGRLPDVFAKGLKKYLAGLGCEVLQSEKGAEKLRKQVALMLGKYIDINSVLITNYYLN